MLNEMEVTGQAFEEMQEQNSRLLQQLKEKDDANFKLMSEVLLRHRCRRASVSHFVKTCSESARISSKRS